jgi:pyruvate formate lyase activating enzyme
MKNKAGTLYPPSSGEAISIAIDPVEKKPLYHFYPSTNILSIGTNGCNLKCPFCQNWQISTQNSYRDKVDIKDLLAMANENNSVGIGYTYNQPLVWYEFVLDCARIVHSANLKNVLVTNGCINRQPLLELIPFIDAVNVDLKGFNDEFYKWVKGDFQTTLNTIKILYEHNIHLELTNLVIPGKNDNPENFTEMCSWISSLSKDIPLHISRYFPNYKLNIPPTPVAKLKEFFDIARQYLHYVYVGNVYIKDTSDTYCPYCKELLVERSGYKVKLFINKNICPKCGETLFFDL